jgi:DNA-binding transcriptional regulator YiaG
MEITCEHSASSYGIPVILDDSGHVMDYAPGIKAVRVRLGLTAAQLAERCGVSVRTVNAWEIASRNVPASALNMLATLIKKKEASHA